MFTVCGVIWVFFFGILTISQRQTDLSERRGEDGGETNLKLLKQQRLWACRVHGPCPVMRGRVSVSLSGACVHWASQLWMEARMDAGFIFIGQLPPPPNSIRITVWVTRCLNAQATKFIHEFCLPHNPNLARLYRKSYKHQWQDVRRKVY